MLKTFLIDSYQVKRETKYRVNKPNKNRQFSRSVASVVPLKPVKT